MEGVSPQKHYDDIRIMVKRIRILIVPNST